MKFIYFYLCTILGTSCHLQGVASRKKCISVVTPDFGLCTSGIVKNLTHGPCRYDNHICSEGFNVSFIRLEPFSHRRFTTIVTEVIQHCCGSCVRTVINNFQGMNEVSPTSINSSDIVYPILGRVSATSLYGYYFVPLWDVPGAYYITTKRTKEMIIKSLIKSCSNLWPLFVVMLLMALVAGFIVWMIETWANKEMFQRTFLIGLFDGFWWSFVSMTTVGYGDKIPKLLASRVFSVLWILIGITICSMFTASLTTEITNANLPENCRMEGKLVGVIKESLYDSALVASHGGIVVETKGLDQFTDVKELITNLKKKKISGFILDKFSYLQTIDRFDTFHMSENFSDHMEFFMYHTLLTEVSYGGDKLVFGAILKRKEAYDFFLDFIMDNRLSLETCSTLHMNSLRNRIHGMVEDIDGHNIFSADSGISPSVYASCAVLGFMVCFGITYELARKNKRTVAYTKTVLRKIHSARQVVTGERFASYQDQ